MSLIDENMAEQAALDWFEELGYECVSCPDIAPQHWHALLFRQQLFSSRQRIGFE